MPTYRYRSAQPGQLPVCRLLGIWPVGERVFSGLFAHYQSNLSPNCSWREVVEVLVMTPAVGDGPPVAAVNTTGFGALNAVTGVLTYASIVIIPIEAVPNPVGAGLAIVGAVFYFGCL
jgi:hypothetical protein